MISANDLMISANHLMISSNTQTFNISVNHFVISQMHLMLSLNMAAYMWHSKRDGPCVFMSFTVFPRKNEQPMKLTYIQSTLVTGEHWPYIIIYNI
jgi:hypothetical protein